MPTHPGLRGRFTLTALSLPPLSLPTQGSADGEADRLLTVLDVEGISLKSVRGEVSVSLQSVRGE